MSLERLLDYPDAQMVVLQSRYGYGWFAGIELEDFPVICTANDNNGEYEVDYYGQLSAVDPWFPYTTGDTPIAAAKNLEEKLSSWSKEDVYNVTTALNILRSQAKMPAYGLKVVPANLKELAVWVDGWDNGSTESEDIFISK